MARLRGRGGGGITLTTDVKWNSGKLQVAYNKWEKRLRAQTRAAVQAAAEMIQEQTKLYIASWDRARPSSIGPGRQRTGQMHDAVEVRPTANQGSWGNATVGWLDAEDYYAYQEAGFNHIHAGWIPGMFAFTDAWDEGQAELRAALRAIL